MSQEALGELTVIEICSAVAGPYVGKVLADNGANVIKVEPLGGSMFRRRNKWYDDEADVPEEFTYRSLEYNTSKRSIAIDLKSDEGSELLWRLLEEADVLVENMRPGTLDRLGFSWEEMNERNPRLIYGSVTGYGDDGPYADRPAYDNAIQGVSGWAAQNRAAGRPREFDIFAIDHSTAMYAVSGVLMAVIERERSGRGQKIDIAMLDAAISYLGHQLGEFSAGRHSESVGKRMFERVSDDIFETADGFMVLNVQPEFWTEFCDAIDREEFASDHKFSTASGRHEHYDELKEALEEVLRQRSTAKWIDYFAEHVPGAVTAPVNEITDLLDDPQVRHREVLQERTHPVIGDYLISRPPITFSRTPATVREFPQLGANTVEILEDLGYPDEEIDRLKRDEVVR